MRNSKTLTPRTLTPLRNAKRIKGLNAKKALIDNQMVFTLPPPRSWLRRSLGFVSDVVMALCMIGAIAAVVIWQWETIYPRVTVFVTPVITKACGVPV